jgi:glycosyltransferase involved in cell wall biosynthesis
MNIPIVTVVMITYGHQNFIQGAIESVLMQKCDFDFELLISNDCSPDNTDKVIAQIIKNHPKSYMINYINHEVNLGMISNFISTLKKAKGKYIAICEGDDYWTDPFKLQKQVDFLEVNLDYGLVHTNNKVFIEKSQKFALLSREINNNENLFEYMIFENNPICTLTVCFRKKILFEFLDTKNVLKDGFLLNDYPIWLYFAKKSKIKLINDVTGVYRISEESASQSVNPIKKIAFVENIKRQALWFLENIRSEEYNLAFYRKYSFLYAKYGEKQKRHEIKKLFFKNKQYINLIRFYLLRSFHPSSCAVRVIEKFQILIA